MPLASRDARVTWTGTAAGGDGALHAGALEGAVPMAWASRTEQAGGATSPEELLAAAHAGCYAMTLAVLLGREGHAPERLDVRATCELERTDGTPEWAISRMVVQVDGDVPGVEGDAFRTLCERADAECAVSAALRGGGTTLELRTG